MIALFVGFLVAASAGQTFAQVITPSVETERLRVLQKERERRAIEIAILINLTQQLTPRVAASDADRVVALQGLDATARSNRLQVATAEIDKLDAAIDEEAAEARRPGSLFLTQAGFEGGTGGGQVSIDAAHLFFRNATTRFYLRSTLPTDVDKSSEPSGALEDRIKAALSDPYGGLLYLSVGQMIRLPDATEGASYDEGVFLDLRSGSKFVQLPGTATGGIHKATAFAAVSAGLRVRESLWTTGAQQAGMFELSALLVANRAIDRSVSELTDVGGELSGWPTSLNVSIGLQLSEGIGLTLRGSPWTNKPLSKDFAIGVTLIK